MLYFCPFVDPDSESSDNGSSDEGIKYQENTDDQEKEEVVSVPRMNPRRLIQGDKRALINIESYIEISKDKIISRSR